MNTKFKVLCSAVVLTLAGQASAATDWVLTTASATSPAGGFTTTVGGTKVVATGWADTGTGSPMLLEQQLATNNFVQYSGGLGINNLDGCSSGTNCDVGDVQSTAPEHAIDNNQRYEMVLLSFTQAVKLTNAKFNWTGTSDYAGGDSDYTVLAYTGTGAPTLAGKTWSQVGSAWTAIGNYANATDGVNNAINGGNVYSSYWLIGAYNPLAGGTTSALSLGDDYLKLASVSGTVCASGGSGPSCPSGGSVPEPGSLALFGFALMGMMGLRKRRQG